MSDQKVKTQLIDSGISTRHVKNWGIPEAIREVLQNYIDAKNEFQVNGTISWSDGIATIWDKGPGIELKHFAFGETDKFEEAIGQFGEGLKSALLHLARENRMLYVYSKNFRIEPMILLSETFGINTLHYNLTPAEPITGTRIEIECTEQELSAAKQYFLQFVIEKPEFFWIVQNRISLPAGNIFVKGSVVGHMDTAFSYHFDAWEGTDIVNRDRNKIDEFKTRELITNILCRTTSKQIIYKILSMFMDPDCSKQEMDLWIVPNNSTHPLWKKIWKNKIAPTISSRPILLSTGSNSLDTAAVYEGYYVLSVRGRISYLLEQFVPKVSEVMQDIYENSGELIRQKQLSYDKYENLALAKNLSKSITHLLVMLKFILS